MNRMTKNVLESLEGAVQFLTEHLLTPANGQVTALTAQLNAVILVMTGHRNSQDFGLGKYSDGTAGKVESAEALRKAMRPIARIGKTLDPAQFPGVRQTLSMPRHGYQHLLARAETFTLAVAPIKAAFVDRGLAADFDDQLQDALDVFTAALERQTSGRAQHVGSTVGLALAGSEGRRIVRAIDAILNALYEESPELYAAWKSVSRVERTSSATPPPLPAAPAP